MNMLLAIAGALHPLAPPAAPMTLTGALPSAVTGAAYSGTLTLGGDFTAPVAIDASIGSIPSWMTVSVSGTTVTFSGTAPATPETDSFTVRATDSGTPPQVVTTAQNVVVSEAGAAPVLVQQAVSKGVSSGSATAVLATAPVVGNTLVMLSQITNTNVPTPPAGWTLVGTLVGGLTGRRALYTRISDGTEGTSISGPAFLSGTGGISVQEWQDSVTATLGSAGDATDSAGQVTIGGLVAPTAQAVPVLTMTYTSSSGPTMTWPAGWTSTGPVVDGSFPRRGSSVGYADATSGAVPAVAVGVTSRGNGVVVMWTGVWIA